MDTDRGSGERVGDAELEAFGHDPSVIENFLRLTPGQRLAWIEDWNSMANYARRDRARRART